MLSRLDVLLGVRPVLRDGLRLGFWHRIEIRYISGWKLCLIVIVEYLHTAKGRGAKLARILVTGSWSFVRYSPDSISCRD